MNRPKLYYNNENKSNAINNIGFFSFSIDGIFFLVGQGREFIVLVLNYLPYTFEFVNFSPLFILKNLVVFRIQFYILSQFIAYLASIKLNVAVMYF